MKTFDIRQMIEKAMESKQEIEAIYWFGFYRKEGKTIQESCELALEKIMEIKPSI
jgi:hypothetical protein